MNKNRWLCQLTMGIATPLIVLTEDSDVNRIRLNPD
jgi:hypothetical protein